MNNLELHKTKYCAVSYEWGSPDLQHDIVINNSCFTIRQNLYNFLHSMCMQGRTQHLLWIDAICIDQESNTERNHQVAQMGTIYKSAEQVFVWLGPALNDSDLVFDFIGHLNLPNLDTSSGRAAFSALTSHEWHRVRSTIHERRHPEVQSGKLVLAIRALCYRPYWSRVWIIQEVLLARHATVLCGAKSCYWWELSASLEASHVDSAILQSWNKHLLGSDASPLLESWVKRAESPKDDLLKLMMKYMYSGCTNPRDKIYALLSLVPESQVLRVDYSTSLARVFCDAFERFMAPLSQQDLVMILSRFQLSLDDIVGQYKDELYCGGAYLTVNDSLRGMLQLWKDSYERPIKYADCRWEPIHQIAMRKAGFKRKELMPFKENSEAELHACTDPIHNVGGAFAFFIWKHNTKRGTVDELLLSWPFQTRMKACCCPTCRYGRQKIQTGHGPSVLLSETDVLLSDDVQRIPSWGMSLIFRGSHEASASSAAGAVQLHNTFETR
jgi:hypothetical protein